MLIRQPTNTRVFVPLLSGTFKLIIKKCLKHKLSMHTLSML